MTKSVFRTSGFREFDKGLLELVTKDARRIGRKTLKDTAKPILENWQAGTEVLTGHLKESENIGERAKLNRRQKRMTPKPGPSELEIHVGTNDPAGHLEEFGSLHNDANPALTRAWDSDGGKAALKRIGDGLGAALERQAKRKKKG